MRIIRAILGLGCLIWLGIFAFGFVSAIWEGMKDYPGKKEFKAADSQITVYSNEVGFGNSDAAKQMAKEFSEALLKDMHDLFKLGSTFNPSTMDHCLTYCRDDGTSVVFLCQIPDLRGFHDDVLNLLAKMAWARAMSVVAEKYPGKTVKLVVGLRGFGSYGAVMEGPANGDPTATTLDDPFAENKLYPYFVGK